MKIAKPNKKKKKKLTLKDEKFKKELSRAVMNANYVCMSITVRTLQSEFDFTQEQLQKFSESYMVLVEECADHRSGPRQCVNETLELTGIDTKEWIDKAFNRYDLF